MPAFLLRSAKSPPGPSTWSPSSQARRETSAPEQLPPWGGPPCNGWVTVARPGPHCHFPGRRAWSFSSPCALMHLRSGQGKAWAAGVQDGPQGAGLRPRLDLPSCSLLPQLG